MIKFVEWTTHGACNVVLSRENNTKKERTGSTSMSERM